MPNKLVMGLMVAAVSVFVGTAGVVSAMPGNSGNNDHPGHSNGQGHSQHGNGNGNGHDNHDHGYGGGNVGGDISVGIGDINGDNNVISIIINYFLGR